MHIIINFLFITITLLISNFSFSKDVPKTSAPNFYLKDLYGNGHFLNDYCGEKKATYKKNEKNVVLISFFATWCLPCREEYPILEKIKKYFDNQPIKIFLIDVKEKNDIVKNYVNEYNISFLVLLDIYGIASKKYNVTSLPHLFIIDPNQYIVYENNGFDPEFPLFETLQNKIDSLLNLHLNEK